ncbi:hypothetical protein ACKI1H_27045 [Pseudomonas sp. YH-1]|uniref:hypothetical protein n=1 Tax=Pseudomonas sp. YH-1 TaxID=3384787 RepID=UPI003F8140FA
MSADLKVVQFEREGWRDAIQALEKIIAQLKSGELSPCEIGALAMMGESGEVEIFGFGPKADDLQVLAMFRLGEASWMDAVFARE